MMFPFLCQANFDDWNIEIKNNKFLLIGEDEKVFVIHRSSKSQNRCTFTLLDDNEHGGSFKDRVLGEIYTGAQSPQTMRNFLKNAFSVPQQQKMNAFRLALSGLLHLYSVEENLVAIKNTRKKCALYPIPRYHHQKIMVCTLEMQEALRNIKNIAHPCDTIFFTRHGMIQPISLLNAHHTLEAVDLAHQFFPKTLDTK